MPSLVIERILAEYSRDPGFELDLQKYALSGEEWAELTAQAGEFQSVTVLRVSQTIAAESQVVEFATCLPNLRKLEYKGMITDEGVRAIAERLPGLTHLDLSGCIGVTDVGAEAVARRL